MEYGKDQDPKVRQAREKLVESIEWAREEEERLQDAIIDFKMKEKRVIEELEEQDITGAERKEIITALRRRVYQECYQAGLRAAPGREPSETYLALLRQILEDDA